MFVESGHISAALEKDRIEAEEGKWDEVEEDGDGEQAHKAQDWHHAVSYYGKVGIQGSLEEWYVV